MNKEAHNRKKSIFISLTHKKSREDIRAKEREEQRPLTKKEKIKIIRRNAKKAKLVAVFSASAISLALAGGGGYLLGAANTSKVQNQNQNESTKDENKRKFKDEIKYNVEAKKTKQQVQEDVSQEISKIKDPNELLTYLKEFYTDEYNEENQEKITTDDVTLSMQYEGSNGYIYTIYKDKAENGDEILRKINKKNGIENGFEKDTISARVENEEKEIKSEEIVAYYNGKYTHIYDSEETVQSYEEGILPEVASVIGNGIKYYAEMNNKEDYDSPRAQASRKNYYNDLVNAVTNYEYQKENGDKEQINNTQKEIDDEER